MIPIKAMSLIITVILIISGYLALIQMINAYAQTSMGASRNILLIDIIIAVMYGVMCLCTGLIYVYSGYNFAVIYAVLALGVLIALFLFIRFIWKNKKGIKKRYLLLFLIYFSVVLYLTVFMRIGYGDGLDTSVVITPFDDLKNAIQSGNPVYLKHLLGNILMFVPFGVLIPSIHPDKLRKCSFAFLGGIICSTVIEGVQLVFRLGQSDIDDIIANSIGAVIGYIIVRLVWQVQKNWKV